MKKVYLYVILTAILFSSMNIALKIAGASIDALEITYVRFLIGGLVLLPPALMELKRNGVKLTRSDYLYLLMLGVVNICLSMICFQFSIDHMNASTSSVLFCINPLTTMMFACTISDEVFTRNRLIAVIIALVGFVFMVNPWDMQEGNTLIGAVAMIAAATFFSLYSVLGRKHIKRIGTFAQTSFAFIFGSLVLMVIVAVTGHPLTEGLVENWPVVLFCGAFVTGFGYLFYFLAIKGSDNSTAAVAFFLKPAIAPIIAVIVLHEVLYWNSYIGIVLILIASYMNMRESKRCEQLRAEGKPIQSLLGGKSVKLNQ